MKLCTKCTVELEVGCFELEVGSSHKKGHGGKEALVKRGQPLQCDRHHGSSLEFPFQYKIHYERSLIFPHWAMTNDTGGETRGKLPTKKHFLKFEYSTKPQLMINLQMRDYRTEPREQGYIV